MRHHLFAMRDAIQIPGIVTVGPSSIMVDCSVTHCLASELINAAARAISRGSRNYFSGSIEQAPCRLPLSVTAPSCQPSRLLRGSVLSVTVADPRGTRSSDSAHIRFRGMSGSKN